MTTPFPSEQAEVCEQFYDRSIRYLVEIPDRFAIARWPRDADVATIARCILGTLKYEPHTANTTALRRALEDVIEHTARVGTAQNQEAFPRCPQSRAGKEQR